MAFGSPWPGIDEAAYSVRLRGTIVPTVSGDHEFRLVQSGRARVLVDGAVVVDATEGEYERGDLFFGFGSVEIPGTVALEEGVGAEVVVEYDNRDAVLLTGCRLGLVSLVEEDLLGRAEALAAASDIAVVVVGTNDDWETEGRDRDLWELPGDQPELIRRVSAVNPRTIVVLNVGAPHSLDWIDIPAAVLSVGFGGQELGAALVDMLFGDAEPAGRMPTTVPARYEHFAAYLNYPGDNSVVRYGEGVFIGHRWHDVMAIEPAVPFGFGLGYTSFDISGPRVATAAATGDAVSVEVEVTNTGGRRGSEVVQVYVEPVDPAIIRPVRELKGFAKLTLDPGERRSVRIDLEPRAFAYFDPADADWERLSGMGPVPAEGGGLHRSTSGWYVDPGDYRVRVGRSSRDFTGDATVTLDGDSVRLPI